MNGRRMFLSKVIACLAISANSLSAYAVDTLPLGFGLDIPREYYNLPTSQLETVFSQAGADQGRCWKAYTNGRNLGYNFAKSLSPSCEEIILPLGEGSDNEWTIPSIQAQKGENITNFCNRLGYAAGFETTILNTAVYCSKQYEATVVNAVQAEYNRCYKSVAKEAVLKGANFAANTTILPDESILIPKESAGWQSFIDSLTVSVNSPLLQNACRIAISHAERKQPPVDFASGLRENSDENNKLLYDGESQPFRIGQAWDAFKSSLVASNQSPFSGGQHLRANLVTDNNWWAGAAYIPHSYEPINFKAYKKLRFQAKSDRPVTLWVFLVKASPNDRVSASSESNSVQLTIGTSYQNVEIPISSFSEFPLEETQGIVFGVSVDGVQKYTIDIDDLTLLK